MVDVERAYRNYDRAKLTLGIVSVVLLAVINATQLWQNARAAEQRASSRAALAILVACTTPPSERRPPVKVTDPDTDCYTRSQAATAKVLGQIGDLSAVAAACGAAHPGDVPGTRACVERALKEAP